VEATRRYAAVLMARSRVVPDAPPPSASADRTRGGERSDPEELDRIDDKLVIWQREIADLDPVTEGIVERIQHLAYDFDQSMAETLAASKLDRRAFQLLMELRRAGPPYRLSAGTLADSLRLSTGAMTNRLDRLEGAGFIRRLPDPNDRRGTLIEPTEAGHAAWDEAVGAQARREAMFSKVLTEEERDELHRLLRRLMRAFPSYGHGHAKAKSNDAED
jgi:DNA-binding MarR family transcriptional regulator